MPAHSALTKAGIAASLVLLGIATRLLPHLPNATAVTAAICAGTRHVGARWSYGIALAILLCSDALLGWYDWRVLASVYGSFMCIAALSALARSKTLLAALLPCASVIFFLITNAAVWAFTPGYSKDAAGLLACYAAALPFLRNMMLGDIAYALALFSAFDFLPLTARVRQLLPSYAR